MGKSIRSKAKRTHRRTKRESGVFAAQDAARLQRLSLKLTARKDAPVEQDEEQEEEEGNDDAVDGAAPKKISTHGPRNSGREQWRKSKGLAPRRKTDKTNRQGVVQSTKRAGRAKRRR
ncbi:hypothetical protein AURDEDRAFT_52840 [Auricularia subglabra TFB-10046 SS5]|nr:hypothetical protein AURDEDRAFT_52840 [Auricularia subglabra TFB-10046 SS5]